MHDDQRAELDAPVVASAHAASRLQHSKCGPSRLSVQREEVVPRVDDVVPEVVGRDGGGAELAPGALLGMELRGDADAVHGILRAMG